MNFKFDQLAVVVRGSANWVAATQGIKFPVRDVVTAQGLDDRGHYIQNTAELAFNYDLWPMEYEVLHYIEGKNWHQREGLFGVKTSHFGTHVGTAAEVEAIRALFPGTPLQEVVTIAHTNPACADRRYHYLILDAIKQFGCALKVIRRLTLEEADVVRIKLLARKED